MRDYVKLLCTFIEFIEAKTVVEVGMSKGVSSVDIANTLTRMDKDCHLFGFDIWTQHGLKSQYPVHGSKKSVEQKLKAAGNDNFTLTQIDTINNRSNFEKILDKQLDGKKIDFAFVDACHSYIGIKTDFEVVYPRLSDIGIVAFHDTLMIDGCREFVHDLRTKFYDGTYDMIDLPFGYGGRRCGVSFLIKRSFAVSDRPIDQICGSPSTPDDIELNEVKWLNSEVEKHENHEKLNKKLTNDDMHPILNSKNLRPTRIRKSKELWWEK